MQQKNRWFLCIRKVRERVSVRVMSSEEVRSDPLFSIVGKFPERGIAEAVRAMFGDESIISNWEIESAMDYSNIRPQTEEHLCFSER
ncbi:MAG: hypothetical protein HYV68_03450 [Candidatus Taylorbacteria bacterium]|nr:hypothetical protein [Candidatus Taylorbacteria bacterium]